MTVTAYCQMSRLCPVSGKIEPAGGAPGDLYVELREAGSRMRVQKEPVSYDGSFQFHDVPSGSYEVRVVTAIHDDTIVQEFVEVNSNTGRLLLRMPEARVERPVSGMVSVKELQAKVPKKAMQAFLKAQQFTASAKPDQAIAQLRQAIDLDPKWRDAHVNLGVQLVRLGRFQEALEELELAIRIGPPSSIAFTNYGAALAALNRVPEGEAAVRQALRLDPTDQRAQYLLGHILARAGLKDEEALDHLRRSFATVPAAHIIGRRCCCIARTRLRQWRSCASI